MVALLHRLCGLSCSQTRLAFDLSFLNLNCSRSPPCPADPLSVSARAAFQVTPGPLTLNSRYTYSSALGSSSHRAHRRSSRRRKGTRASP
jgi:hypothetical protein